MTMDISEENKMYIKGYSDFSLSRAGVMFGGFLGAHFKFDNDVTRLFPYINAYVENAKYYDKPEYIQFAIDDVLCTLYPKDVIAAPLKDQDQALNFVKRLIDFLNDIYVKKDTLEPNYKKFSPVSVFDIYRLVPQTNCKDCGYTTCMAFAAALSKGETTPDRCPGFREPMSEIATYPVFDKEGNLEATISIEIDTTNREIHLEKQKKHIEKLEKKLCDLEKKQNSLHKDNTVEIQTDLTDREIQVLRFVAEGATNTEISDILSISPHTVKSHIIHIFNKLGVNDRTQAAVWATRHKIV
jgi:ArsR family metal-binding transcriptional regulator/DNA-binding CsgD family transcriptional regulator